MEVTVITKVVAPDGATHYFGDLLEDPTWIKFRKGDPNSHATRQYDLWFYWKNEQWYVLSEYAPHWALPI